MASVLSLILPVRANVPIESSLGAAEKKQLQQEARLVVDLLQNYHYSGRSFREIENKEMIARFLQEIDPGNYFFTADDIAFIHSRFDRTFKSVYLLRGDLQPAFEIFDLLASRREERSKWVQLRLEHDFDFTIDENFADRRKEAEPSELPALDRRWELLLKEQVLEEILLGRDGVAAAQTVAGRYREADRQLAAIDAIAVREKFFDALIRSFDPHSGYFSADSARDFAIEMENAIGGAGFELKSENGAWLVATLQTGGPADLDARLQPGDTVTQLADGDKPLADAAPMSPREIRGLLRGAPGTKLHVAFHTVDDARQQDIALERARVVLGDGRAHGAINTVPVSGGSTRKIGSIAVPMFYAAGEKGSTSSVSRDVHELIEQMLKENIQGLVLDLRDNPGGALPEAVALSALFIPEGTVLLSRGPTGPPLVHAVDPHLPIYTGPLAVLTSRQSASASEVFVGAMKFHRRAVIIGASETFGKGTVQNYVELAKTHPEMPPAETNSWGTLRITEQRFYLPNGRTVQRDGVAADVTLPENLSGTPERESDLPHALKVESIPAPESKQPSNSGGAPIVSDALLQKLQAVAKGDVAQLTEWKLWQQGMDEWRAAQPGNSETLNLEKRRTEWNQRRAAHRDFLARWRQLAGSNTFVPRALELAQWQAYLGAHETMLRQLRNGQGEPIVHRLYHGYYTFETEGGHLRRLAVDEMDFTDYEDLADALATAFNQATGVQATAAEIRFALRDVTLIQHRSDQRIRDCFAKRLAGGGLDQSTVARGLDAVLGRLVESNPDWRWERRGFDVPLREGLRVVSEWAAAIHTLPAPPVP